MCKYESVVKFLDAMRFFLNAFVRTTYLNTLESVFAADICCHSNCFVQYVHLSIQSEKQNMVLLKLNQTFRGSFVSFISIAQR